MPDEIELFSVALKVFAHRLIRRIGWRVGIVGEIAESGHDAARVGAHGRPDAAMSRIGTPLTADALSLFKENRLETLRLEVPRGRQPPGPVR